MALANEAQLNAARLRTANEPPPQDPLKCSYNELHPDGSIWICILAPGHDGPHQLTPITSSTFTWSFQIRLGPPAPPPDSVPVKPA